MDTDMVTAMLVTDTDIILVMDMVMLTVMVTAMDTDTPMLMLDTITANDLLNPLLSPLLLLNLDMVTVMLTDTDTPMLDTITAKGLLKPSPLTVTVTVMASKFILLSFLSNYYKGCVYKKFYDWRILICDPQYLKLSLCLTKTRF